MRIIFGFIWLVAILGLASWVWHLFTPELYPPVFPILGLITAIVGTYFELLPFTARKESQRNKPSPSPAAQWLMVSAVANALFVVGLLWYSATHRLAAADLWWRIGLRSLAARIYRNPYAEFALDQENQRKKYNRIVLYELEIGRLEDARNYAERARLLGIDLDESTLKQLYDHLNR